VCTPNRALYTCFPFSKLWEFRLVYAMFWTNELHFGLPPTDAVVCPTRRTVSTSRTSPITALASGCFVWCPRILISESQFCLTRASEILGYELPLLLM
jgi:hypothetical protein